LFFKHPVLNIELKHVNKDDQSNNDSHILPFRFKGHFMIMDHTTSMNVGELFTEES